MNNAIAQRFAARDLAVCLALSDARKAENAAARKRMQSNAELCSALLESAARRGLDFIALTRPIRD